MLRPRLLMELLKWLLKFLIILTYSSKIYTKNTVTMASCFWTFLVNFSFKFVHLQLRTHCKFFVQWKWKKSYQLLIWRVSKNPTALKFLNHFSKSSTVAYKWVNFYAYNNVWLKYVLFTLVNFSVITRYDVTIIKQLHLKIIVTIAKFINRNR